MTGVALPLVIVFPPYFTLASVKEIADDVIHVDKRNSVFMASDLTYD